MSAVSRVGYLRSGYILAVLKDAGTRPEVRGELIRASGNIRMSLETARRSEERIRSRGQVVAWLDVTSLFIFGGERDKVGKTGGVGCGRMVALVKEELYLDRNSINNQQHARLKVMT